MMSLVLLLLLLLLASSATTPTRALRFAIIGDWGMGGKSTPWMPEIRSAQAVNEACAEFGCNFTISCGDNIYTGNPQQGFESSFLGLYQSDVTGPFFLSSGNHDNVGFQLGLKNPRWKWGTGGTRNRYYDFVVPILDDGGASGHTAHFFALDSIDGSLAGGGQYNWLESKLAASASRWKIMFAHYPFSGSGRHKREGSVVRLAGLMDKYNVQVYFSGHDHLLDVSAMQGRALPISGAMSRGGMMIRGIGGKYRKFTLTQPGEYNKFATDWPGHGFFTAEMSPNVLTVHGWDHYGGVMYSFAVTFDWIQKVKTMPESMWDKFPPADEVKKAAAAERTLGKGPGGGIIFGRDGSELPLKANGDAYTEPPVKKETTQPGFVPNHDLVTIQPKMLTAPGSGNKDSHHDDSAHTQAPRGSGYRKSDALQYVTYTVSSECDGCVYPGVVYSKEPFSVYVLGVSLHQTSRIYLTTSKGGCSSASTHPQYAEGTGLMQLIRNMQVFTVDHATTCYVCLSIDGKNYWQLTRENVKENNVHHFDVRPNSEKGKKTASGGASGSGSGDHAAVTGAPSSTAAAAAAGGNAGSSGNSSSSNNQGASMATLFVVAAGGSFLGVAVMLFLRNTAPAPGAALVVAEEERGGRASSQQQLQHQSTSAVSESAAVSGSTK